MKRFNRAGRTRDGIFQIIGNEPLGVREFRFTHLKLIERDTVELFSERSNGTIAAARDVLHDLAD